ncbi:MAG TPA: hypothetical protein VK785_04735 [Opitutaceae bacterium]|nr:hypothetical protein [Opitutaceae bacterium]
MSLLPADTPRLPKWPFMAGDATLLAVAALIGHYARNPFAGTPLILIVASVAFGAVLAAMPFIADYAHQQDEALDERQRGLEALARTVTSAAEQISIAAQSLPGIAETAAKNLALAEQLPARLQEKAGEIKQRLAETSSAKNEALAQELAALHASESKRLETTADHIRKAAAELAKLETAAQKNLATARDGLDAKAAQILDQLDAKITALATLVEKISIELASSPTGKSTPARTPVRKEPEPSPSEPASGELARPELVKQAEPAVVSPVAVENSAIIETVVTEIPTEELKAPRKRAPKKPRSETPEPALDFTASNEDPASPPSAVSQPPSSAGGDEFSQSSPDDAAPVPVLSADGATRLLVTAYIGIGNKLFLRGEGPGLSWDEGVPLQFVSIGKWRWETADATAPVRAKLYKNDDIECVVLGELALDPGQQAEVTAAF